MKHTTVLIALALTAALAVSSAAYGIASAARRPLHPVALHTQAHGTSQQQGTGAPIDPVRSMELVFQHQLLHQGFHMSVEAGLQEYFVTLGPWTSTGADAAQLSEPRVAAHGSLIQTVAGLPVTHTFTRVGGSLIATIPKTAATMGGTFTVAAWEEGTEWDKLDAAFYRHELDFDIF